MHACTHIHTDTHPCTRTCPPMYTQTHLHRHMFTNVPVHTYTHRHPPCPQIHPCNVPTDTYTCTYAHAHKCTHAHTVHTDTHTCTYARVANAYTHARMLLDSIYGQSEGVREAVIAQGGLLRCSVHAKECGSFLLPIPTPDSSTLAALHFPKQQDRPALRPCLSLIFTLSCHPANALSNLGLDIILPNRLIATPPCKVRGISFLQLL